jgi:RNA polymerase sigma factor for flagellar operon FliA
MGKNTIEQEQLFIDYAENPSIDNRNKIIEEYYPILKKMAYSKAEKLNWKVLPEELTSYGVDGLIAAINKYDITVNDSFIGFANMRINGSMIDNMRRMDFIPRSVRVNNKLFEEARIKVESEKCRLVSGYEVAEEMGIDASKYSKKVSNYQPVTFSSLEGSDDLSQNAGESFVNDYNNSLTCVNELDPETILDAQYIYKIIKKEFIEKFARKKTKLEIKNERIDKKRKEKEALDRKMGLPIKKFKPRKENKRKKRGLTGDVLFDIWYQYEIMGYTMDEISERQKISESRVSQLYNRKIVPAIEHIREKYGWNNNQ